MNPNTFEQTLPLLLERLENSLHEQSFVKLTLSKPRQKTDLQNIYARLLDLQNQPHLSFTLRFSTKDETKNFPLAEGIEQVATWLTNDFFNAHLFTTQGDFDFETSKKEKVRWVSKNPTFQTPPDRQHDQAKTRFVQPNRPYLQRLGIADASGRILPSRQSKYKQIDKYIEIFDALLATANLPETVRIVDMGSGKGYLTFALYDYLTHERRLNVRMTGIELRPQLVEFCNEIAAEMAFSGLNFLAQDVHDYPAEAIDVLIALHACDVATDVALAKGIASEAALVVVAPCCHKQIRQQMHCQTDLQSILKHGILEERQAEMLTDGIRALMLEGFGYKSKVFEFVSTEHTPKNLMIVGTRTTKTDPSAFDKIAAIKQQFGIEYHYLETLLGVS